MNYVEILLDAHNKKIFLDDFEDFSFMYYGYKVHFYSKGKSGIVIKIISKRKFENIFNFFLIIHKMIFFNYGYFLSINYYKENEIKVDYKKYCNLDYLTSDYKYVSNHHILSNEKLFTINNISTFKKREKETAFLCKALYYLKSDAYSKILYDQKFIIMTQIAEGFIESTSLESEVLSDLRKRNPKITSLNFFYRINYYTKRIADISRNTHSSIYKVLNTSSAKLAEKIKQTRHKYSHFIAKDNTINLQKVIYYYYLLDAIFRIIYLERCGISYDYNFKVSLQLMHDWILDNCKKNANINEYKTTAYILQKHTKIKQF